MPSTNYDGPIVIVGGAPSSGTTVTHALICTSARVNDHHPEISYVRPMVQAYKHGLDNWENHTRAFFGNKKQNFRLHMRNLLGRTFSQIHRALKQPELLCVKDPLLTPYFPRLLDLFGDRVRFVTVVRHPYDIVRSRQEVATKAGTEFTAAMAQGVASTYNQTYLHLDNPSFGNQLLHFRYEDLLADDTLSGLRTFTGCPDISVENVWGERQKDSAQPGRTKAPRPGTRRNTAARSTCRTGCRRWRRNTAPSSTRPARL